MSWVDSNGGISAMASSLEISSLVPRGLIVESVNECEDAIEVTVRSETTAAACPSCGSGSQRVHSRYLRRVADLPCTGRRVSLSVIRVVNRLRILTPDRRPKLTPYDPVLFTALGSVSRAASLGLFLCSTGRLFLRPDRLHFARRAQALSRMTRSVTGESRRGASWTVASTARC